MTDLGKKTAQLQAQAVLQEAGINSEEYKDAAIEGDRLIVRCGDSPAGLQLSDRQYDLQRAVLQLRGLSLVAEVRRIEIDIPEQPTLRFSVGSLDFWDSVPGLLRSVSSLVFVIAAIAV
jgi:hypothetical protein